MLFCKLLPPENMMQNSVFLLLIISLFTLLKLTQAATQFQNKKDSCIFPPPPRNGKISIFGRNINKTFFYSPGAEASSETTITISCNKRYFLSNESILTCNNGSWSDPIGECLFGCPPYYETKTTKVTCRNNGKPIDCETPTDGTIATFKCAPFYEDLAILANPFRVCRGGTWDFVKPDCTPKCGRKPKPDEISKGHYPWNVAIYNVDKNDNSKMFFCTGSLINERIVVTAAHCLFKFDDGKREHLILAAGKTNADFNSTEDPHAQYSEVEEIYVPDTYLNSRRRYTADLGLIVAETPFEMTARIQPICIDWTGEFSRDFEWPQIIKAYMAAPLKTEWYPNSGKSVQIVVPLVNHTTCYGQLSPRNKNSESSESFYTFDKICSGYINRNREPDCRVNHGTGLISKKNGQYYLIGVTSIFPSLHRLENCDNNTYVLFTQISVYAKSFILEKNNLYKPIPRSEFQHLCGIKSVTATTLIVDGQNTTRGDYPWQIALYRTKQDTKVLICGGSIINSKIIITAAHCVTDAQGSLLKKESFVVAAGKYFRDFDDPRDKLAQFTTIKHIFVPPHYAGQAQNFVGDIAVVITENAFKISREVQPICIDWQAKYEKQFVYKTAIGFVSGWGYTEQNSKVSDILKDLQVPYIDEATCREKIPVDYEVYLTYDKLCAGFQNQGKSVCGGDSGGGLVFKNKNDNRYYLAGVVSLSPQAPDGGCDSQQYSLYTRVSTYITDFIYNIVRSNAA